MRGHLRAHKLEMYTAQGGVRASLKASARSTPVFEQERKGTHAEKAHKVLFKIMKAGASLLSTESFFCHCSLCHATGTSYRPAFFLFVCEHLKRTMTGSRCRVCFAFDGAQEAFSLSCFSRGLAGSQSTKTQQTSEEADVRLVFHLSRTTRSRETFSSKGALADAITIKLEAEEETLKGRKA
jgi:hypothetical protein